jgi:UDP-N-acetylmuramyl pentapeptide phosphotransferase/UDP-N-acetylglucosamine-1-phosphate transferase
MLPVIPSGLSAILLAFTGAFFITWYSIPLINKISKGKNLTDKPSARKIHHNATPTLGGMAIFLGFAFGFLLTINDKMEGVGPFILSVVLLLFIGVKDDLLSITPTKKIVVQLISGTILCIFTNIKITNFHGLIGIREIPVWGSFLVTIFLVLVIVNSFNLIDGIDGLASSLGIIASTAYGFWFLLSRDFGYAIMSSALTGSLLIFLFFNVSNGRNKIFMGDTGSLTVGFILTVMTIHFNEINSNVNALVKLHSAPSVSIAILIVPLFDTIRVMIARIIRKRPIFKADNRHIHHMLLRAGFSHYKSTLLISLANIMMIIMAYLLDSIGILWLGLVLLLTSMVLTSFVYIRVAKQEKWNWDDGIITALKNHDKSEVNDGVVLTERKGA